VIYNVSLELEKGEDISGKGIGNERNTRMKNMHKSEAPKMSQKHTTRETSYARHVLNQFVSHNF
jgi:hypothetical protein